MHIFGMMQIFITIFDGGIIKKYYISFLTND